MRKTAITAPGHHLKEKHDNPKENTAFEALIKACAVKKDISGGTRLHADIVESGLLGKSPFLATTLVLMYLKCGVPTKAQEVLDQLAIKDVVSWSALISGFAQHGRGEEALSCFARMQNEGVSPNAITLASTLKACGRVASISKGEQVHVEIVSMGFLEKDIVLGTALVDMYAKCGELVKAHDMLHRLPVRDVIAWSALLAGYTEHGKIHEALDCFEQMQHEGLSPNAITFTCILKACANIGALEKGEGIHEVISSHGMLEKDITLGTALVDMYAKCNALAKAQKVLIKLPVRNVVTWSALIAGYAEQGHGHEALNCFEAMQCEGLSPDVVTFICILKVCGSIGALTKGKQIHKELVTRGLLKESIAAGNALVDMYVKCGELARAQQVLKELPLRDVVSWSSLISGFSQHGQWHEALECLDWMQKEGLFPNAVTFICILKACSNREAIHKGKQIHEEIVRRGLLSKELVLGNALVDMYVKCEVMTRAQEALEELPIRDVISWNSVIAGYAQLGQCHEALNCFERMQVEGISPDVVTFICILKGCGSIGAINKGNQIEGQAVNSGFLEKNIELGNTLVDMYTKCGALKKAQQILEELPVRDAISWNALIAGCASMGQGHETLSYFEQMRSEGHSPDAVTFISILRACGSIKNSDKGEEIHEVITRHGWLEKDITLGNALTDMYVKCGMLSKAQEVLEGLRGKDIVSWNALISGFSQEGQYEEALGCFQRMQSEGFSPDTITFICILKACASTGAIDKGKCIHSEVVNRGLLVNDMILGNCLLDMYVKCGELTQARQVLEELPSRDMACFNTLITGYALQGKGYEALNCFRQMQVEGLAPDEVTFLCVLTACSHSGLLDEAEMLFGNMTRYYGIAPTIEHLTCMIVVFGSRGFFKKVMWVIKVIPSFDNNPAVVWIALLGVCRKWGNVAVGKLAFDQAIQSEKGCSGAYVLMANIFSAAGMREDAECVESMRLKYASRDGIRHSQNNDIYAKVREIALEIF